MKSQNPVTMRITERMLKIANMDDFLFCSDNTNRKDECNHEFNSSEWRDNFDTEPRYNGTKECHQPTIKGSDKCQYHAQIDRFDEAEVTTEEAFESLLTESDHVLGAEFHNINLDTIELGTEGNVDLHNAKFLGGVEISNLVCRDDVTIAGCVFDWLRVDRFETTDSFQLDNNYFRMYVKLHEIKASGKWQIQSNVFEESFRLRGEFDELVQFNDSTFDKGLLLNDIQFRAPVQFKRVAIDGDAYIHKCVFSEGLDLEDADPDDRVFLSSSEISDIVVGIDTDSPTLLLCNHSKIEDSALGQPNEEPLYYDFTRAILGEVKIPSEVPLSRYYFHETEYDGFRFSDHRDTFSAADWQLHKFDIENAARFEEDHSDLCSSITPPSLPNYGYDMELKDNEETYLLARKAATEWGDNDSASNLYRQERNARKGRYLDGYKTNGGLCRVCPKNIA